MERARSVWSSWLYLSALAAFLLNAVFAPLAWSAPVVNILSPKPGQTVAGDVAIIVAYESTTSAPIVRVELYIDGTAGTPWVNAAPRRQGRVSFSWDTRDYPDGAHTIKAEAFDSSGYKGTATVSVTVAEPQRTPMDTLPPRVVFFRPVDGQEVRGTIEAAVDAQDESGVYSVLFFIDDSLHQIQVEDRTAKSNPSPFTTRIDTTRLTDGPHRVECAAYDPSDNVARAEITVMVNNTGPRAEPTPIPPPLDVRKAQRGGELSREEPQIGAGTGRNLTILKPVEPAAVGAPKPGSEPSAIITPPSPRDAKAVALPRRVGPPSPERIARAVADQRPTPSVAEPRPQPPSTAEPVRSRAPAHHVTHPVAPTPAPDRLQGQAITTRPHRTPTRLATARPGDAKPMRLAVAVPGPQDVASVEPRTTQPTRRPAVTALALNLRPTDVQPVAMSEPAGSPATKPAKLPLIEPRAGDRITRPQVDVARWAEATGSLAVLRSDLSALAPAAVAPPVREGTATTAPLAVLLPDEPAASVGDGACRAKARMVAMLPTGPRAIEEIAAVQRGTTPAPPPGAQVTEPTSGMATMDLGSINVVYDGEELVLRTPALVRRGMSIAPLREIFEHTDGVLYWYPVEKRVEAIGVRASIGLKIGDKTACINGEQRVLELAPFIKRGRTMVPAAFLAETLNVVIKYDPQTKRILISSKDM